MYTLRGILGNIMMRIFSVFPLKDEVIFSSFDGQSNGDNPRVIYETMRVMHPELKYIWFISIH